MTLKISIISPGRFGESPIKPLFEEYAKRTKWKIDLKEIDLKLGDKLNPEEIKRREAVAITKCISEKQIVIALDERGEQFSSIKFSKLIQDFMSRSESALAFIIGGSCGLDESVLGRANFRLSLGSMTFPHMLVRAMLMEQIYRAYSILSGHPYHK